MWSIESLVFMEVALSLYLNPFSNQNNSNYICVFYVARITYLKAFTLVKKENNFKDCFKHNQLALLEEETQAKR